MRAAALVMITVAGFFWLACAAAGDESAARERDDYAGNFPGEDTRTGNKADTYSPLSFDSQEMDRAFEDSLAGGADTLNYGPDTEPPDWDPDCDFPFHVGDLIISEVFSASKGRHGAMQWIEIYNTLQEPVCINSIIVRSFGENPGVTHLHAEGKIILPGRGYGAVGGQETRDYTVGQWENGFELLAAAGTVRIEQSGKIIDHVHVGAMKAESIPSPQKGESVYLCSHCLDAGCSKIGANWGNIFACHPPKCIDMDPFDVNPYDDTGSLGTPGMDNPDCAKK